MFRGKAKFLVPILMVLALIGSSWFWGKKAENAFHNFFAPPETFLWRAGNRVSGFLNCFFNQEGLQKENEQLKAQTAFLLNRLQLVQEAQKENQALKSALDLSQSKGFELVFAEIISQETNKDVLLINQGKASRVLSNMPVITAEGVLVGRTGEVFENFSRVNLISLKDSAFDITISTQIEDVLEDVLAVARGEGGLKLGFEWAPVDKEIAAGNKVFTSVLGGKFPKGLLVGEVVSFQKNPAESFQKGTLLPYFTNLRLEKLFVITNFQAILGETNEQ